MKTTCVHQMKNGRWIVAYWNAEKNQWQSSNRGNPEPGYFYSYSGSLEGLAGIGIKTYSTRASARKAAVKLHGED